ncbi:phage holin family protein [Galbibacter sp.]|uniref:phage holin family protein n=1 Tax=Galbibacter sp. TaxID=2918471 RepID=UPI002D1FA359|nr:phage holin family protein [Galbibacter sp.]
MKMIIKLLLTAVAVVILANVLPGISVDGYVTAIIVAVVLALLNFLVKPILVLLTLPATILTLGLFLLVINAIVILIVDYLVQGFAAENFWWALIFSLLLTILQSIFNALVTTD